MTDKADLRECPFNKDHVLDRFVDGDGLKAGCKDCQIFLPIEAWQSRATPAALTQNEVEELGEAIRYVTSDDGISLTLSRGNTYQAVLKLREAARLYAAGKNAEPDYKKLLINLLSSLSLADHLGDIADDAFKTIELMGIELPDCVDNIDKFGAYFSKNHNGTTVYGTTFDEENYDEEYNYIG